ncbi:MULTISPECIES: hypothetical protein, partial [unclassified Halorhodospira]|uniref:hypothetical protein n=1 Tax=unclassified Halorhodospira TaxID=2626748 RepID=UPI001EE88851
TYSGSEITPDFARLARERHPHIDYQTRNITDKNTIGTSEIYNYVILSGVFHQPGDVPLRRWAQYMKELLLASWDLADRGIAFNVLNHHADFYRPGNYYADLNELQIFVSKELSRFYFLDNLSPLFETTFLVYKPEHIKHHTNPNFQKYLVNDTL